MMETLPFGRTNHMSTRAIFGAAALGEVTQEVADSTFRFLLEHGVNHVDTAASYGDSELRIGSWIARHGKSFFLATKVGERTARQAREGLLKSLERLRVEQIDLLQLHNLVDLREWETAMGPGGALEAAIEAQAEGLVGYIGVTGHGPAAVAMHLRSLERFDFDAVLLPYSHVIMQDGRYAAEFGSLVETCETRHVAVQTIKAIARRPWENETRTRMTWYEPLEEQADIDLAVHWVLGHPRMFVNTVGDPHLLPRVLAAIDSFKTRPAEAEMRALVQRCGMMPLFRSAGE